MATLGSLVVLAGVLFGVLGGMRWIDREVLRLVRVALGIAGCAAAFWGITVLLPDASPWVRLPVAAVPALAAFWAGRIFTVGDMALLKRRG